MRPRIAKLLCASLAAATGSSTLALALAGPASASGTPTVSNVSPASGSAGTSVTITGSNYPNVSNVTCASQATSVTFAGVTATSCQILSPNVIDATAPGGPGGAATVVVDVAGTSSSSSASSGDTFTYNTTTTTSGAPVVSSISPAGGSPSGGTTVTITGSNFTGVTSVTFGGVPAESYSVLSATSISAVAPPGGAGTVAVVVNSSSGSSSSVALAGTNAYAYDGVPTITSISPLSASAGSTVTIYGSGFLSTTGVEFGSVGASYTVLSDSEISAVVPTGLSGTVTVTVSNPAGTSAASPASFTAGAPVVTSVSPSSGAPTGGTAVTITGSGFENATSVLFGTTPATSYTIQSDTTITAVAPAGAAGTVTVTVANPSGTSTGASYTYTETPVAIAVAASADPAVIGQSLTLSAQVNPAPDAGLVSFANGATLIAGCSNLPVVNGTVQCSTSFSATGPVPLAAIFNGDGTYSASISATVPLVIDKATTATNLSLATSSATTAVVGTPVTFDASVSPSGAGAGTPTGSVTFEDNGTAIAACTSVPLSGTGAACSVTFPRGGNQSVTAVYNGDGNFAASTSSSLTEGVVVPALTVTTARASRKANAVPVTVTCKVAACSGTLELTRTENKKPVELGSVTFNSLSPARHTLDVRLYATGKRAVAGASRTHPVSLTLVATLKTGGTTTKKLSIS